MKTIFVFLFILVACNSSLPKMDRISEVANAFIIQYGVTTTTDDIVSLGETKEHTTFDYCADLHVDKNGNIYCTGQTNGSIGDSNGVKSVLAIAAGADTFVAKFDSAGKLLWFQQPGENARAPFDTTTEQQCYEMDVDEDGNVYCVGRTTGNFWGQGAFGGARDGFLMKLNSSGQIIWIQQFGKQGILPGTATAGDIEVEVASSVKIGKDGNIYVAGYSNGNFVAGGGANSNDMFLIKFSPGGTELGRTQLGSNMVGSFGIGSVAGAEIVTGMAIDNEGNIVIAANTTGSLTETNSEAKEDPVLWKVDTSLSTKWISQYHYTGVQKLNALIIDENGNIFGAGQTDSSLAETNSFVTKDDVLMMKFDRDGYVLKLAQLGTKSIPQGNTSKNDVCYGLTLDRHNNVYCAGQTFGNIGEPNAEPALTTSDILVAKWDHNLNFIGASQYGSRTTFPGGDNTKNDQATSIHIDYFGNLYLAGVTDGSLGDTQSGLGDLFILKLDMSTLDLTRPKF